MEDASSFRIVDGSLRIQAAGVAANREFDFVLRFDGEVESSKEFGDQSDSW